ncbi:MAG: ribosome biogenesis GTP-binding protein YihA/YsxC [Candidatus Competibacteraceae bacterium]|jgi:GTP-binding protein|nr:ribosome biogenesis GTP-binding protein YihA/YsxC [Candidatus Competibacteraceae bacterium]
MSARYRQARFLISAYDFKQLPAESGLEVAFAGRSNAGKSSALNVLTGQKALARISKTPGRTQLINYFEVEPERFLVDLPGYGYAKVPEPMRRHWRKVLAQYLNERSALQGLFLLMDIRHPLTELDRQMLLWCAHRPLPIHVLLTKSDKLKHGAALNALRQVRLSLERDYPHASVQLFSALKRVGVSEAHEQLDRWLGYSPADQ